MYWSVCAPDHHYTRVLHWTILRLVNKLYWIVHANLHCHVTVNFLNTQIIVCTCIQTLL